jgi:hypothetical protein
MTEKVRADGDSFGVDGDEYLARVWADVETFGRRIGLHNAEDDGEPPARGANGERASDDADVLNAAAPEPEPAAPPPEPPAAASSRKFSIAMPRCFGCLLTLICGRRLARA